MALRVSSPLIAFVLLLTACDSGETTLPIYGEFSATATSSAGDSTTFSGNAFARFDGDTLQSVSLFEATDEGQIGTYSVIFAPRESASLSPGTYRVGGFSEPEAPFTGFYVGSGGTPSIESGELTIVSITDREVAGRFTMEGSGRPLTTEGPTFYTIAGSFDALVTVPPQ